MEFTHTFTDAHGASLTDAVIKITHVSIDEYTTTEYTPDSGSTPANKTVFLNVSAEYWLNQAAKNAGKLPYQLYDPDGCPLQKLLDAVPSDSLTNLAKQYIITLYPTPNKSA